MIETPQITTTTSQSTAVIRFTIPRSEIQVVMHPAISEVFATVMDQQIGPAGAVFSYHYKMDPEIFDFEVGVPVTTPVRPTGRVVASQLPAVKVARTIYQGPYEGLGLAWGEFEQWMKANHYQPAINLWESYASGPESGSDPSQWRTEFNRPLLG